MDHVVGDGLSLGPILLQILHQVVELARLQELAHVIAGNRVHSDLKPTALHVRVHVILSKEKLSSAVSGATTNAFSFLKASDIIYAS